MMKTSGNKTYTIKFLKNVIEKEIPALPAKIKLMVQEAIKKRLTVDPFNLGKPLCHSFRGQYRIRVSNYRIIYVINHSERKVLITAVGYRKNIYKHRRLHN
ncbi:type II toxin-antitoxin system RelE/ParE family toxin [Wolbachia endosymbiont of Drosophila willistoni]|uniref:type II toxin-antitoxin system RelE family toxin n=1 Tax=Wolbachia endosymbiont of Drosophila willistoni TaxID=295084 RepID=UPI0032B70B64